MSDHIHRYRLAEPNGPQSIGLCACGQERVYQNWIADADYVSNWNGSNTGDDPRKRGTHYQRSGWPFVGYDGNHHSADLAR